MQEIKYFLNTYQFVFYVYTYYLYHTAKILLILDSICI